MKSKFLFCFRVLVSFAIACSLGMSSISNANAIAQNQLLSEGEQVLTVDGEKYKVSVEDTVEKRVSVVRDESGKTVKALRDKKTGKIIVNGTELLVEDSENELTDTEFTNTRLLLAAHSKNKVLSRRKYTIPAYMANTITVIVAASLAAGLSPYLSTLIGSTITGSFYGKPIKVTITEYRTASRYKSGQHKGRYKYWTNVLVKSGNITLLNINDSIMYSK